MPIQPVDMVATMRELASDMLWPHRLDKAKEDESRWRSLIEAVFITLADVMEFIGPQTSWQAKQIVDEFSDEDFREWKEGVEKGVTHDDWEGLLEHRACQLDMTLADCI